MLNKKEHPFLIETLCAILMILPQGKISNIVKNRLEISKIIVDSNQKLEQKTICSPFTQEQIEKYLSEYLECQKKFPITVAKWHF